MRNCPNCGSEKQVIKIRENEFIIVQCSACGLVFIQNPPDEREIYENYYDISFKPEDYCSKSRFSHLSEIFEINRQRLELIRNLKLSGGILDIGCGSGFFLKTASDVGLKGHGIDVSKKALALARDGFGLNVSDRTTGDLLKENERYNIITLWHVLEHFLNPVEELKKIHGLLTEKGCCLIEVPNFNSVKFRFSNNKWKGGNHPLYHRSFFTSSTLSQTLKLSGFSRIKRLNVSYILDSKSIFYNTAKKLFNLAGMDTFLNFIAYK